MKRLKKSAGDKDVIKKTLNDLLIDKYDGRRYIPFDYEGLDAIGKEYRDMAEELNSKLVEMSMVDSDDEYDLDLQEQEYYDLKSQLVKKLEEKLQE